MSKLIVGNIEGYGTNSNVNVNRLTVTGEAITGLIYGCISGKLASTGYVGCLSVVNNTTLGIISNSTDGFVTVIQNNYNIETLPANISISVAAGDGTYHVIKENGETPITTLNYTRSFSPPTGGADGDYWLCVGVFPHIPYKRISGSWVETLFVKMFTLTKSGGVLTIPDQTYRTAPISFYGH